MPDALGSEPRSDQRGTDDLLRLIALPQAWTGRDPAGVAEVLLDEVVHLFRAEVGWVRLVDGRGTRTEQARAGGPCASLDRASELGRRMEQLPGRGDGVLTLGGVAGLRPGTQIRLASAPIGDGGGGGLLVVGSDRPDFPTGIEQLLLRAAAGSRPRATGSSCTGSRTG
jgi:hypothetical protein